MTPRPPGISIGLCLFGAPLPLPPLLSTLNEALHARSEPFEILLVDNNPAPWTERPSKNGLRYFWNEGKNLLYGPSLNQMARKASHPSLIYLCAPHVSLQDPAGLDDLLAALWQNPRVAQAGSLQPGPRELPYLHIQGGVVAWRTDVLLRHPYSDGFPQAYSDVWMSERMRRLGYQTANVASVFSSHWGDRRWLNPEGKILHRGRLRDREEKRRIYRAHQERLTVLRRQPAAGLSENR